MISSIHWSVTCTLNRSLKQDEPTVIYSTYSPLYEYIYIYIQCDTFCSILSKSPQDFNFCRNHSISWGDWRNDSTEESRLCIYIYYNVNYILQTHNTNLLILSTHVNGDLMKITTIFIYIVKIKKLTISFF